MNHIIDQDDLTDAISSVRPTEDRPAPAVEIRRPTPIGEIPRWGLKPVPPRSRRRLEASF
jgi:hypothetical protein